MTRAHCPICYSTMCIVYFIYAHIQTPSQKTNKQKKQVQQKTSINIVSIRIMTKDPLGVCR